MTDSPTARPAILDGSAGPRTEVVHQVENAYSCDTTQGGGGCCSSMRMGEMKLIIGGPGDSRTIMRPAQCVVVPEVQGYKAPCPTKDYVQGCLFECGDGPGGGCEECECGAKSCHPHQQLILQVRNNVC
jgi:hypothetical protein